jgi:hypothetical protein
MKHGDVICLRTSYYRRTYYRAPPVLPVCTLNNLVRTSTALLRCVASRRVRPNARVAVRAGDF